MPAQEVNFQKPKKLEKDHDFIKNHTNKPASKQNDMSGYNAI